MHTQLLIVQYTLSFLTWHIIQTYSHNIKALEVVLWPMSFKDSKTQPNDMHGLGFFTALLYLNKFSGESVPVFEFSCWK